MAEAEVVGLREALRTQSADVRKLLAELEEERQAAASGAEEALSMIARLQEEKAAAKMEARQYKRIAEEKLRHADESLLILREVMLQKEMEVEALRFLVQDYRHTAAAAAGSMKHQQWSKGGARTFLRKGSLARNISLPAAQLEELSSELEIRDDKFCCLLLDDDEQSSKNNNANANRRPAISDPVHLLLQENQNCSHCGAGAKANNLQYEEDRHAKSSKLVVLNANKREKKKSSFGMGQTDVEQLKKQMQKLESDMKEMRHVNVDKGRELMHMLARLAEQLDDMKSLQVTVTKADANSDERRRREDDYCALTCLGEAMLSFWI